MRLICLAVAALTLYGCGCEGISVKEPQKAVKHHWVRMIAANGDTLCEWRVYDDMPSVVDGRTWSIWPVDTPDTKCSVTVAYGCSMVEEWR
jgi:hypothetical protein